MSIPSNAISPTGANGDPIRLGLAELVRYFRDPKWAADHERRFRDASAGNVSFLDYLLDRATKALAVEGRAG
jgi:hypothetical protein